jgi:hypothetical protein
LKVKSKVEKVDKEKKITSRNGRRLSLNTNQLLVILFQKLLVILVPLRHDQDSDGDFGRGGSNTALRQRPNGQPWQ